MATILVVDDEPTIRSLLRAALERRGYELLEAADGVGALEIAQRRRPDLIVLDVALPQLNGLEVCRRLKQNPATAAVPVFLLTGFIQDEQRREGARAGVEAFIAKPFSPVALADQIAGALKRRPAAAAR